MMKENIKTNNKTSSKKITSVCKICVNTVKILDKRYKQAPKFLN